jgi:hypothetical protein
LTHIDGWVIRSPNGKLEKQRIVEIDHDKSHRGSGGRWSTPLEAAQAIVRGLADIGDDKTYGLFLDLLAILAINLGFKIPIVFLKQVRDASQPARARHQEVLDADGFVPLSGFRGGGFLEGDHDVLVNDYISHPIRMELGLPSGKLRPRFAFELDFDFDMRLP